MKSAKIKHFEDYTVYSDGRVYSSITNKFLKPCPASRGYLMVGLYKNKKVHKKYVHRLVAEAFLSPINETVNHKNGNKKDNRLENLEWCTYSENHSHAFSMGLKKPRDIGGMNNINRKLTALDAIEIYKLATKTNLTQKTIADMFNIDRTVVGKIKNKKLWAKETNDV